MIHLYRKGAETIKNSLMWALSPIKNERVILPMDLTVCPVNPTKMPHIVVLHFKEYPFAWMCPWKGH